MVFYCAQSSVKVDVEQCFDFPMAVIPDWGGAAGKWNILTSYRSVVWWAYATVWAEKYIFGEGIESTERNRKRGSQRFST